jgi:soluble lytic murein transglycosylase-like protein
MNGQERALAIAGGGRRFVHSRAGHIVLWVVVLWAMLGVAWGWNSTPAAVVQRPSVPKAAMARTYGAGDEKAGVASAQPRMAPWLPQSVTQWAYLIVPIADANHVDPNLAGAIMTIESCGQKDAVSRSGAEGLMQLMAYNIPRGRDAFNAEDNIRTGVEYLGYCLAVKHGDIGQSAACYNAGPTGSARPWSAETQAYVKEIGWLMADVSNNRPDHRAQWAGPLCQGVVP